MSAMDLRATALACLFGISTSPVFAEILDVWQGATEKSPCVKVEFCTDGFVLAPIVVMARQEIKGSVKLDIAAGPDASGAAARLHRQVCTKGVDAATVADILNGGNDAWDTFFDAFRDARSLIGSIGNISRKCGEKLSLLLVEASDLPRTSYLENGKIARYPKMTIPKRCS